MDSISQNLIALGKIRKIGEPQHIPIEFVHPDPNQPRKDFYLKPIPKSALNDLKDLASSIKKQGLITPILISVMYKDDSGNIHYKIVDGERRFRATVEVRLGGLGEKKILAQAIEVQDPISLDLIRLTVQSTNKNWDPYDQANAEKSLLEKLGNNVSEVAKIIGVSRQSIINHQRIFDLKEETLAKLKDNGKELTYARETAKLVESLSQNDRNRWPDYEEKITDKILSGKIKTRDEVGQLITAFKKSSDSIKNLFFEDQDYTARNAIEASGVDSDNTAKEVEVKAQRLIEMLSNDSTRLRGSHNTELKIVLRKLRNYIDTFITNS